MYFIKDTKQILTWRKSPTKHGGTTPVAATPTAGTLATPTLTTYAIGTTSATLRWNGSLGATSYTLERTTDPTFVVAIVTLYTGYDFEYQDSGLTANTTYYYRVQATASGFTSSSYGAATATTAATTRVFTINTPQGDGGKMITNNQYYDAGTNTTYNLVGGDTFKVYPAAWSYFYMSGLKGTAAQPITIINEGDVTLSSQITIDNCSGVHLSGLGTRTGTYGLKIQGTFTYGVLNNIGVAIQGLCDNITADGWWSDKMQAGLWIKNEVGTYQGDPDCGAQYWYPSAFRKITVTNFKISNSQQDALYMDSSDPYGKARSITCGGNTIFPRPTGAKDIIMHDFIIEDSGRQGIQWGGVFGGTNKIYNFVINNSGHEFNDQQGAAIAVGSASNSVEIYSGTINGTFRQGIYSYGYGLQNIHDITFDNIGTLTSNNNPNLGYYIVKLTLSGKTISGSLVAAGNYPVRGSVIKPAGSEYTFEVWSIVGNVVELKTQWTSNTTPSQSESATIIAASTTAIGSHAGTYADPYVGFGASATITSGEISVPARGGLPYGQSGFMMHPYDGALDPTTSTFWLKNLTFNTITGTYPIEFLGNGATNHYGAAGIICGVTFGGVPITNSNITKEVSATTCSWTLSTSC